jgi:hypothetical protein
MRSRSDTLYKQLFAHPEMVRELLAGFLPAPWARALQVSALERVNASYAGERGKQRHQDMVWRAHIGGDWVYVYILQISADRPAPQHSAGLKCSGDFVPPVTVAHQRRDA